MALIGNTAAHPSELFTYIAGERTARRITEHNSWLPQSKMGKQSIVRYAARDGLEIEGILIKPVGYKKGNKYPLLVVVHGGPESNLFDGWLTNYSRPGQMAAAQGYMVFHPNYRASTGRGVVFSQADQGDLAAAEFDDLVDGVEYLCKKGLVDRSKVGVTGGSYGGYASAWCATKLSKHFAASVMFVGISNQISKRGTTDIPNEDYLVHWKLRTWDNFQRVLESSPIYHIKNAQTPILICHGKDDPRVSVTQSMELYRMLKTKGDVPVRLVLYPGEGHGNRKTPARLDYAIRMMRWFNHYLKGKGGAKPPMSVNYRD
jgi:dipeptidyl aminopeptidase/acylaminoacyl peptidase